MFPLPGVSTLPLTDIDAVFPWGNATAALFFFFFPTPVGVLTRRASPSREASDENWKLLAPASFAAFPIACLCAADALRTPVPPGVFPLNTLVRCDPGLGLGGVAKSVMEIKSDLGVAKPFG